MKCAPTTVGRTKLMGGNGHDDGLSGMGVTPGMPVKILGSGVGQSRLGRGNDDLLRFFGLSFVFACDGAMGVEELVGDVGQDGGAARGYAAFGDEDQEAVEKSIDVRSGIELRQFGEEFWGEVF